MQSFGKALTNMLISHDAHEIQSYLDLPSPTSPTSDEVDNVYFRSNIPRYTSHTQKT